MRVQAVVDALLGSTEMPAATPSAVSLFAVLSAVTVK